jgi:sulfide:quinone oxidoreductase
VIAGGGVAALETALALRTLAPELTDITLVAPTDRFRFRAAAVGEPFGRAEVHRFDLASICRDIGVTLRHGTLSAVDADNRSATIGGDETIEYDAVVVACGAVATPVVPGALVFGGPEDVEALRALVARIDAGEVHSVAFAVPASIGWALPAYELALLTATHLRGRGVKDVELTLVTPEAEPLQLFGSPASEAAHALLDESGVHVQAAAYAGAFVDGELQLIPNGSVAADRVVALPRLKGAPLDGLPQTVYGFIPVDSHCRVHGVADVFAAGDITSFTVKQGGIAAQQADVVAAPGQGPGIDEISYQLSGLLQAHGAEAEHALDTAEWLANEMGSIRGIKKLFVSMHGELFDPDYWRGLQQAIRALNEGRYDEVPSITTGRRPEAESAKRWQVVHWPARVLGPVLLYRCLEGHHQCQQLV